MAVSDRFWDGLYQQYQVRLLQQVQKFLPGREESRDVLQDLYVHLHQRAVDPGTLYNPPAYLMRMATNLAIDALRRNRRSPLDFSDPAHLAEMANNRGMVATPEQISSDRQRLDIVAHAINDLPPRCKEVFLLCKRDHLSPDEVAGQLGISRNMVEKHLRHALAHCRKVLEAHEN